MALTYSLYASGIRALDIAASSKQDDAKYNFSLDAKMHGFLNRLVPWEGRLQSRGERDKEGGHKPSFHVFSSFWRGGEERTTFTYAPAGSFKAMELIEDDGKVTKAPVPPALTDNTVDMLTSLGVMLTHVKTAKNCNVTVPAFDGKRRFDMVFRDKGETSLDKTRYSNFTGKARICEVEIKPVAGKWREKPRGWMSIQEQSRAKGKLPRLFVGNDARTGAPLVARAEIHTGYGAFVMHLRSVTYPGDQPAENTGK